MAEKIDEMALDTFLKDRYRMNISKTYLNICLCEKASYNIIFALLSFIEEHCLD